VELYTEPWARAYGTSDEAACFERFRAAADRARKAGLGINAGHDLNLVNLARFLTIPDVLEVSIGHALTADALFMGLEAAVRAYHEITAAA
jgi:pyridoxine 5-phosphate synthase